MSAVTDTVTSAPLACTEAGTICFHCGEAVPPGIGLSVMLEDRPRPVCCIGCEAVMSLIIDSGQASYYHNRDSFADTVPTRLQQETEQWIASRTFDSRAISQNQQCLPLLIDGIHCAACVWLIEQALMRMAGVISVNGNLDDRQFLIHFDPDGCSEDALLQRIMALGFRPFPSTVADRDAIDRRERTTALKRLGVAGLGMMQVMMFAAGSYFDPQGEMTADQKRMLDLFAMLVTAPVLLYAGRGFFTGALRALSQRRLNMDVPVSLALLLAFTASTINVFRGHGDVWFESVTMFCFFLLLGRTIEMRLRHRSRSLNESLLLFLPDRVQVLDDDGKAQAMPRQSLKPGMTILVHPGALFPADGELLSYEASVDESLLTGESRPVRHRCGDAVLTGSRNLDCAVRVNVTARDEDNFINALSINLKGQASSRNDQLNSSGLHWPERLAGALIATVLVCASLTWLGWQWVDPSMALPAALSVLVVTCPCALSLSVPAALAAASARAARLGALLTHPGALMRLRRVGHAVFDKTGTLTSHRPQLEQIIVNTDCDRSEADLLAIAAALESRSAHPLAQAFSLYRDRRQLRELELQNDALSGWVDGERYSIGSPDRDSLSREALTDIALQAETSADPSRISLVLCSETRWLAVFHLRAPLLDGASGLVDELQQREIRVHLASGDRDQTVAEVARQLGADDWRARFSAEEKAAWVADLQQEGESVLMVGDGLNDAPVLARADVSVAMGHGPDMTLSCADVVMTSRSLTTLRRLYPLADNTSRIIRQNLAWALGYNLATIPLAMAGLVAPWMAALGMSASSLLVTLNATRILRS